MGSVLMSFVALRRWEGGRYAMSAAVSLWFLDLDFGDFEFFCFYLGFLGLWVYGFMGFF